MIEVHAIEVVSDAGPMDDYDPEFAVPVRAVVSVDGADLARMLRVQRRVMRKRLKKLGKAGAISALLNADARFQQHMSVALRPGVRAAIVAWAYNMFDRPARVDQFDWTEDTSQWGVQIEPKQEMIAFDAEVDVLGTWG